MWLSKPMGYHFGVGEFTTHFRTYFSGDWDVHWGYGLLTHGHIAEETGRSPLVTSSNLLVLGSPVERLNRRGWVAPSDPRSRQSGQ